MFCFRQEWSYRERSVGFGRETLSVRDRRYWRFVLVRCMMCLASPPCDLFFWV